PAQEERRPPVVADEKCRLLLAGKAVPRAAQQRGEDAVYRRIVYVDQRERENEGGDDVQHHELLERQKRKKVFDGREPYVGPIVEQDMLPLILAVFAFCFVIERIVPGWNLPRVKTWPLRVIAVNIVQLGIVLLAGVSWERWLSY